LNKLLIVLQHDSKPKRRPQLKSCIKNEIPSPESNSLVLTALTVSKNIIDSKINYYCKYSK